VVRAICAYLDRCTPDPAGPRARLIHFVTDRPGHDFRYEIDPARTEAALDWRAPHDFTTGLERTIDWYLANRAWWEGVRGGRYAGQRLGIQPVGETLTATSAPPLPATSAPPSAASLEAVP
jgi:dTDP-glucose 4,6-dehydratase